MKRDFTTLLAVFDGIPTAKETNVLLVGDLSVRGVPQGST